MENKTIIISVILVLIIIVCTVYFVNNSKKSFRGEQDWQFNPAGNISLSQEDKDSTVLFFGNASDIVAINDYCQQNMINCMYYCREINPEHEVCSGIISPNMTRREMGQPGDRTSQ